MITAQRIMRDIRTSGIEAGELLPPERAMIEQYGVGRGTLREALRYLEFQGVVEMKPGPKGGPVVQIPDGSVLARTLMLVLQTRSAPFRVVIEARIAFEPLTAQLAASRLSDEALQAIRESVSDLERNMDDRSGFLEASRRFHDLIALESGNALFDCLVNSLHGIMDGSVIGIDYPTFRRKAILEDHRTILQGLELRNPELARDAMRSHMQAYLVYAETKYPDILEQPVEWDLLGG